MYGNPHEIRIRIAWLDFGTDCRAIWQLPISLKMNRYVFARLSCMAMPFFYLSVRVWLLLYLHFNSVRSMREIYFLLKIVLNTEQHIEVAQWISIVCKLRWIEIEGACRQSCIVKWAFFSNFFNALYQLVARNEVKCDEFLESFLHKQKIYQNGSSSQSIWDALVKRTYQKERETNETKTARIDLWFKRSSN